MIPGTPPVIPVPEGMFCSQAFSTFIAGSIYPVIGLSAIFFALVIGVLYMVSQAFSNPRLAVWARTEIVQLGISLFFIVIVLQIMTGFCDYTVGDVAVVMSAPPSPSVVNDYKIAQGAEAYLVTAGAYAHTAMVNARYFMGAINEQESYSTWKCPIWCFLSTSGTGETTTPQAGASYLASGFSFLLNSSMMSFFSAFMHVFFLRYVGSGLFLFLFPVALITRSLPFLRNFGSLILAVVFSFYIIYPVILAALYAGLYPAMVLPPQMDESALVQSGSLGGWAAGTYSLSVSATAGDLSRVAGQAANAFLYAVLLPNLALVTTAAASAYVARLMGEEIDLSRLTQMV